ncbi:DUF2939 domain-containing protein [Phenylobacterium sp.]|uniref:DUF2939 domain-containing protein n=1 Tax=Phenylobacterium sp. TaxID=1871053 RepID=UPI0035AD944C
MKLVVRVSLVLSLLAGLAACATVDRYDAARDVHALLVSIRDNDQQAFEAHVDRQALERQIEGRLMAETQKTSGDSTWNAVGALLARPLAELAGDALIQPRVFRTVAEYYGYTPDKPIPGPLAIGGALKPVGEDQVCATRKKNGPCFLTFTRENGVWRLSGFEGQLSDLRTKS